MPPPDNRYEHFMRLLSKETGVDQRKAVSQIEEQYHRLARERELIERQEAMRRYYSAPPSFSRNAFVVAWDEAADLPEPPKPKPPIDLQKLEALKAVEPHKVMARVPDAVECVTGWRAWKVQDGKLTAIGQNHVWPVKNIFGAKCTRGKHKAPQSNCECGIWAFKSMDNLIGALNNYLNLTVLGAVSLWGRVIETENGFRAQYAYPKELWLLDNSLEELGYTYGVPVRTA